MLIVAFLVPVSACSNDKEAIRCDLGDGEAGYLIWGLGLLLVLCGDQKEQPGPVIDRLVDESLNLCGFWDCLVIGWLLGLWGLGYVGRWAEEAGRLLQSPVFFFCFFFAVVCWS